MGKARSFSDSSNDAVYQKEINNENFAMSTQQNSYNLGSTHFSDQSGIGNFSQSGTDQRKLNLKGGLMQGNIGHIQQTAVLDISTNILNLNTDGSGVVLSVISEDRIVTLSSGTTGTLTTITGAQRQGQRLTLYNISTNTITITHTAAATVNTILTPDNTNFTFSNNMVIELVFDITTAKWRLKTGTSAGGGGGTQTPWTSQIEGAGFTLNQAGKITIKPIQTDGLEGILELTRNDTTPSNGDTLGKILFDGPDSGATNQTWASIDATYENVTAGAKQGQFTIKVQKDNSLLSIIDYTGDDATLRFSSGVDVVRPNANGSKELGTSSFFWDDVFSETFTLRGSNGNTTGTDRTIYADGTTMIFNMPSGGFTHSVNNEIYSLLTNGELSIRTTLANGPTLRLRNNDQTPSNNDTVAAILFTGEDSALAEATYGSISSFMSVVTAGAKQAAMSFRSQQNNSLKIWMNYLGASDKINIFATMDANNRDVLDMGGGTINLLSEESVVDTANDFVVIYDASVLALRKVKIANLPGSGGSFLPLSGGTMSGAIAMGDNDISGLDDIFFTQSDTSIEIGADIVTHDFPSAGTWRVRAGSTSRVIIDTGFRITSSTNIGVFGNTAVAQQSVASDTLANLYTALRLYGWIA